MTKALLEILTGRCTLVFVIVQMMGSFKRTPQAQTEARRVQSFSDPVTTVVVFLVKELHKNMLVFVMKNQDVRIVCADKRCVMHFPYG
jgi:hypothetical protein